MSLMRGSPVYARTGSVLRVPDDLDPETIDEIEEAMSLPIGHVRDVLPDGRIRVVLSGDGLAMLALGYLAIRNEE